MKLSKIILMKKIMPNKKINVGVVFGGRSGEHEVSIVSAQSVIKALNRNKYNVIPIGITKAGQWLVGDSSINLLKTGKNKHLIKYLLAPDPTEKEMICYPNKSLVEKINCDSESKVKIDVIFPVLHGTYGEDGTIQGLFEMANMAYVGAGVLGSAVGMDKIVQKKIFFSEGLNQVKFLWLLSNLWKKDGTKFIKEVENKLKYPVFVKPVNLGSSVGISKVHNRSEFVQAMDLAGQFDRKVIVEQGLENIREIECSILGNDSPIASVPGEIVSSNEFYDYDAKYIDGKSKSIIPAKLPNQVIKKVQDMAIAAFKSLDLCGMARVDFFITKNTNEIYINEVNTIPGFTSISMYPKLWEASGLSYDKLLDELIRLARERHNQKNKLNTSFKPKNDWYK